MRQMSQKRVEYAPRPIIEVMTPKRIARFWRRVERRDDRRCWLWRGGTNQTGYGLFQGCDQYQGFSLLAHRISWALANGREPSNSILHSCDNPGCCNPAHLRDASTAEGWLKAAERQRVRYPHNQEKFNEANRLRYTERWPLADIAMQLGVHRSTLSRWFAND